MTPEEQAVIDAAIIWSRSESDDASSILSLAVAALEESRQPQLRWFPRTWADVRPGDRVRMPIAREHPDVVKSIASALRVGSHRPWTECGVILEGAGLVKFPADAAIEIEMHSRVYEAMMLFGGWEARVSQIGS